MLKIIRYLIRWYWNSYYKEYRKKYDLSETFNFNGVNIELYGDGLIQIGANTYCGNRCALSSKLGFSIKIGSNCSISHNVRIYTSNRNSNYVIGIPDSTPNREGNVQIGNGCWIGANVFICENVVIGDHVVIGANSVVTKNLMSNSVYAGSPAKLLKKYE